MPQRSVLLACILALLGSPAAAQVALNPASIQPGAWKRFALQVVNQADSPVSTVRLTVPEVLQVLGTDAPVGWSVERVAATDSTPFELIWRGGMVVRGAFREFAFLARLPADARRADLVFPVGVTRSDGSRAIWGPGGEGQALVVTIRGTTGVSAWGAFAFAGGAMGVAILALALALRPRGSA